MQNEHLALKSPPNDKHLNSNSVLLAQSPAKKEVSAPPKQIEVKQLSMTTSTSSIESFSKKLDKLSQSQSEKPQVKKRENIASKSEKLTIKKIDLSSSDEEDFNTNSKTNNSNDF